MPEQRVTGLKVLGIDYGTKRTGIAIGNTATKLAFPLCTITMQGKDHYFARLLSLAEQEGTEAFVIGLPLYSDGSDSETTRQVRNMARRLQRRSALAIFLVREDYSSYEASLRLQRLPKKQQHDLMDQMAAVIILESFFAQADSQRLRL